MFLESQKYYEQADPYLLGAQEHISTWYQGRSQEFLGY